MIPEFSHQPVRIRALKRLYLRGQVVLPGTTTLMPYYMALQKEAIGWVEILSPIEDKH